jgi:hypothetical protein
MSGVLVEFRQSSERLGLINRLRVGCNCKRARECEERVKTTRQASLFSIKALLENEADSV